MLYLVKSVTKSLGLYRTTLHLTQIRDLLTLSGRWQRQHLANAKDAMPNVGFRLDVLKNIGKGCFMLPVIFCLLLIIVDQVTKYFAYTRLQPVGSITVIEGVFSFTYLENHGAAFGLFQGARWFFVVITILIICGMIYYYVKLPKEKSYNKARFALLLVMSGAVGNFIDRVRNGFVIDFFHATFIDFPVFNVADSLVVIGVFLMFILLIFVYKEENVEK